MSKKGGKHAHHHEDDDSDHEHALDLNDPKILAALQKQLQGRSSGLIESLPKDVRRRVNALKNIQMKHAKLNADFEKELAALELKFFAQHKPLYEQRTRITKGDYEPTDDECHFSDDEDEEDEEEEEEKKDDKKDEEPVKGIPHFWLTVLQRSDMIAERIQEHDVPVLEHLTDITVEPNAEVGTGFKLHFHFSANEFFTDAVLTKSYSIDIEPSEGALVYEGPVFSRSTGCEIHWSQGKNVTVKAVKKKQKKKGGKDAGAIRIVTKIEKQDSFFHFFAPPTPPNEEDPKAEEIMSQLEEDFEIGDTIREKLVPNAVLWFTGEALEYEDDYDYDEEGAEEGEDGDFQPPAAAPGAAGQKPECKQN
jgi:nucleosome assembly protein 1-like 1